MNFTATSQRIEQERRAKFCGTASVKVASLKFRNLDDDGIRESLALNIEPLKRMFREERGCRQDDIKYHAKVTISPQALVAALDHTGLQRETLLDNNLPYPKLEIPPNNQIVCLQRYDRASAYAEVFEGGDKRWIVDLFSDDLSEELERFFVEEFEYQKAPDDGKFYRKIRSYQGLYGEKNAYFERLWLGQLSAVSKNRRDLFEQLKRHDEYLRAFDRLLDIPALFCGFRLTVIHQMICMRCEEPHLTYLKHILDTWRRICGEDPEVMRKIDEKTVETLQGTAPGACSHDNASLLAEIEGGKLFGNFSSAERGEIWSRVCAVSRASLIPSLHTFFEDLKFLKEAAACMRRLVHLGPRDTLIGRLEHIFDDVGQNHDRCMVQVSEGTTKTIPGCLAARLDLGCRQLWLAAFRYYRDLPSEPKKKDILAKARKTTDESVLFSFMSLAYRLGFESQQIRHASQDSPDRKLAERTLLKVRKPGQYSYPSFEEKVNQMLGIFATAVPVMPEVSSDRIDSYHPRIAPTRFGMPHDIDHERDKRKLFLPQVFQLPQESFPYMTSFFVRQSVYFAFFKRDLPPDVEMNTVLSTTRVDLMDFNHTEWSRMSVSPSSELANSSTAVDDELHQKQSELARITNELSQQSANLQKLTDATEQRQKEVQDLSSQQINQIHTYERLCKNHQEQLDEMALRRAEQNELIETLSTQEREKAEKIERLDQLIEQKETELSRLTPETRQHEEPMHQTTLDHVATVSQGSNIAHSMTQDVEDVPDPMETGKRASQLPDGRQQQEKQAGDEGSSLVVYDASKSANDPQKTTRRVTRFEFSKFPAGPGPTISTEPLARIPIEFKTRVRDGSLVVTDRIMVDPADPSVVQRIAEKYMRKQFCLFDVDYHNLIPKTCFEKVVANGTNTIVVMPFGDTDEGPMTLEEGNAASGRDDTGEHEAQGGIVQRHKKRSRITQN
ncbi:hypothetical protein FPOA_06952 [Fusarium poae]|uniref:Uncharacterized protein n=1 Tax=Fusarium poae TaxID=36050 RepID=A0A1B8AJ59_FUSPO|nr:hypothetical protein FPOA_06952 [Fusarium poae]